MPRWDNQEVLFTPVCADQAFKERERALHSIKFPAAIFCAVLCVFTEAVVGFDAHVDIGNLAVVLCVIAEFVEEVACIFLAVFFDELLEGEIHSVLVGDRKLFELAGSLSSFDPSGRKEVCAGVVVEVLLVALATPQKKGHAIVATRDDEGKCPGAEPADTVVAEGIAHEQGIVPRRVGGVHGGLKAVCHARGPDVVQAFRQIREVDLMWRAGDESAQLAIENFTRYEFEFHGRSARGAGGYPCSAVCSAWMNSGDVPQHPPTNATPAFRRTSA